jgi:hypothetical protein
MPQAFEWKSGVYQKIQEEVKADWGLTVERIVEPGRVSRSIESRNQLDAAHSKRTVTVFLQARAHGDKKGGSCRWSAKKSSRSTRSTARHSTVVTLVSRNVNLSRHFY